MFVEAERGVRPLESVLRRSDDIAMAAITVAELLTGVELSQRRRRLERLERVESLLETIPVEDYDVEVARAHAFLLVHTQRAGQRRGAHDIIVAATARATQRVVLTADARGFVDLPGVGVRIWGRDSSM